MILLWGKHSLLFDRLLAALLILRGDLPFFEGDDFDFVLFLWKKKKTLSSP